MGGERSNERAVWSVVAWGLAATAVVMAVALAWVAPARGVWGDEGVYLAMVESLAADGDLVFGVEDRDRALGGGRAVILQRTPKGLTYSKPVVYPLLAVPFWLLFGGRGLVVLNALATAAALLVAWRMVRQLGPRRRAALTLASFAGCGVLPFYLGWRMSDSLLAALALAGSALVALALRAPESGRPVVRAAAAGLLLGLVTAGRLPGGALVAAALLACVAARRWRPALSLAVAAVIGFGVAAGAGLGLAGTANPYKAVRSSFTPATGYPVGEGAELAGRRFETDPATQSAGLLPRLDATRSGYSALYYVAGRHTGLLLYFPAALLLAWTALRRPDRVGLAMLAGPLAMALFYLLWQPENYFGGSTFLGNRYFLMAYPALLAALPRLPSARALAVAWGVALVVAGSAVASLTGGQPTAAASQAHAHAGVFRWLPSESTAQKVDGFRPRFWSRDFVRFVDPYADVGDDEVRLAAGRPAASLELAVRLRRDTLSVLAVPEGGGGELVVSDWRSRHAVAIPPEPQVVELPLSPAWRWHRYWWGVPDVYQVRALRLAWRSADPASSVELRFLGDGEALRLPLAARLLWMETTPGAAGEGGLLRFRVFNAGRGAWIATGPVPVRLRLDVLPAAGGQPVATLPVPLGENVESGGVLEATVALPRPLHPGPWQARWTVERPLLPETAVTFASRELTLRPR